MSIDRLIPAFKTEETQDNYLIKLRMFFEFCGLEPDQSIEKWVASPPIRRSISQTLPLRWAQNIVTMRGMVTRYPLVFLLRS